MLGTPESERLEVTALNLFHPTASPPFEKWVFSCYDTTSNGEREGGRGHLKLKLGAYLGFSAVWTIWVG